MRLPAATLPRRRGPVKRPCSRDRTAPAGRGLAATLGAPGRGQKKPPQGGAGREVGVNDGSAEALPRIRSGGV